MKEGQIDIAFEAARQLPENQTAVRLFALNQAWHLLQSAGVVDSQIKTSSIEGKLAVAAMELSVLGETLEQRRKSLKLSRAEVARQIGVNISYLYRLERAEDRGHGPSQPSHTVLEKWLNVLGYNED